MLHFLSSSARKPDECEADRVSGSGDVWITEQQWFFTVLLDVLSSTSGSLESLKLHRDEHNQSLKYNTSPPTHRRSSNSYGHQQKGQNERRVKETN